MNFTELILKKRQGESLSADELKFVVDRFVDGTIPDYQMSAFLMAIYFRGMTAEETQVFTRLMFHSGDIIDLSDLPGIKVDKHSTGGVGDKISIPLASIVASCGVNVPMISGRGLGHTGGTLDKLESIPGFTTDITISEFQKIVSEIGVVMVGQTKEIAPADRRMYKLRDVTATVESIPLIAGSIMSKKLAEGIDALVLDVKTGRGAFMQTYEGAVHLAQTLVDIGTGFGKETVALITDMSQPLGNMVGNWLEIVESVLCLRGKNVPDVMELTYSLGGVMLMLGKRAASVAEGTERCREAVTSGRAYEKFLQLVSRQGGDVSFIENLDKYPVSKYSEAVVSPEKGYITSIDSLEIGFSNIALGAGRTRMDDRIDMKAGIVLMKKVGDPVRAGEYLATLYTDRKDALPSTADRVQRAYTIGKLKPERRPLIISQVDKHGTKRFLE